MTEPTASDALEAHARAQKRAQADARWFPGACFVLGLLAIHGGIVIPWEHPIRSVVLFFIWALFVCMLWLMGWKKVTPRDGKTALKLAIACWFILNLAVGMIASNVVSIGIGLALSAIASVPFFVVAIRFYARGRGST
jgi:hypothetical protein